MISSYKATMSTLPRIGFMGLGIMGSAMAKNLHKAGYQVTVYNRDRAKTGPFQEMGCDTVSMPKDLAGRTNIIIAMVTDPAALSSVLEGPSGWFAGPVHGQTLINMSTVSVSCTKKLAERCLSAGAKFLDCPVAGSKAQAQAAQLILLAGGDPADVDSLKPVLLKMGKAVIYAGPAGNGTALKLSMNLLVAQMTTGLAESTALAGALDINPSLIFDVIHESPAIDCGYFRIKEKALLNEDFSPSFALKNMLKDVKLMLGEAGERNLKLPVTDAVRKLMEKSILEGDGDRDLSVVVKSLK